ncbi:MAG: acetoacetate decarboxylase family protein [Dehalococcoidia bacterium]|nr:acetoacetate decarboxylase family protein [Dehalococcoidia bacterium]
MRTRFVKSPEEIQRYQDLHASPSFYDIASLAVTFETDPDVLQELIPPPLEPAEDPRVSLSISHIRRSDCVGPFYGCNFNIHCTYQGEPGFYRLTMPMSTDTAVIFGRELFAEPKKLAQIDLDERGTTCTGRVTRNGITYIELSGQFESQMTQLDRETVSHHYYFKYLPAADGRGLAHDPQLVRVTHRGRVHRATQGTGTVVFRESPHDPVIDVPVRSVLSAARSESETHTTAEVVQTVDAGQFMPYAYGKIDDLLVYEDAVTPAFAQV